MRRRLYFLLPDVVSARRTAADLLLARVEHRHMHVLAKRGTDLTELHEANPLQKTDLVHGAERGRDRRIGGCSRLFVVLTPPEFTLELATVLRRRSAAPQRMGAEPRRRGGPQSQLKRTQPIEAGRVLMVDVRRRGSRRSGSWCIAAIPKRAAAQWNRRCRRFRNDCTAGAVAPASTPLIAARWACSWPTPGSSRQAPHGACSFGRSRQDGTPRRRRRTPDPRSQVSRGSRAPAAAGARGSEQATGRGNALPPRSGRSTSGASLGDRGLSITSAF
jgi:hypothetical protein